MSANASKRGSSWLDTRTLFLAVQLDLARARVRSKAQSRPRQEGSAMQKIIPWAAFAAAVVVAAPAALAQLAISANDGHTVLTDAGAQVAASPAVPDSVVVLDLSANPPRVFGEVAAPASVVGPPQAVAIAPDETFALVTSSTKLDPNDPTKIVPDDRVTVIDLRSSPPKVTITLPAGKGAAGVSLNPQGTLALVANRGEGTISVFKVANGVVTPAGKVDLGNEKAGPSLAVFTRDGKEAYVTRDRDHKIS